MPKHTFESHGLKITVKLKGPEHGKHGCTRCAFYSGYLCMDAPNDCTQISGAYYKITRIDKATP